MAILTPIVEGDTAEGRVDLSGVDFEKLASPFAVSPKVASEKLREDAEKKVQEMAERNPTRVHLVEKLEQLVADYNTGSVDAERFFAGHAQQMRDVGRLRTFAALICMNGYSERRRLSQPRPPAGFLVPNVQVSSPSYLCQAHVARAKHLQQGVWPC